MTLAPGTRLGRYDIRSRLGVGGMGEVYLADDPALGRQVAIKVLSTDTTGDLQATKRLIREAKAAATLDHPNICGIYEVGEADGRHFIVMQRVEGETLAARMARRDLDLNAALTIASQVADALAEAHVHGILHRDIKPQNIMITPRGQAKLMDFGLATRATAGGDLETASSLTTPGAIMGTIQYMSPEQVQGQPLDARSDIFSFGVMLYEMVSGHHPFTSDNQAGTISAILTQTPQPVARFATHTPPELDRIITKAIAKDKGERYQSIKELQIDLQYLAKQSSGDVRPTSPAPTHGVTSRPRGARYLISAGAVVLVTAAVYFGLVARPRAAILTDKDTILLADWENTTGDAVLDGTLKTALAVQLEQSPFLDLFSDARVREALGLMGRSADARVTKAIAREICQRQGLKALLAGSVSPLGSHFVLAIEAIDGHTGEVLARQQEEADSKELILRTLGRAATGLREKLGESLASIQKYDAPFEQATTTSLEAFNAFVLARDAMNKGNWAESAKHGNRAVGIDPNMAVAYAALAAAYTLLGQGDLVIQSATKAFNLRGQVTERERLYIEYWYYSHVTEEPDKATESMETLTRTYPRFATGHNNLGALYEDVGRVDEAMAEYRKALEFYPMAVAYNNLTAALKNLDRLSDAKEAYQQALDRKLDLAEYHQGLYEIAYLQGDEAAMAQQVAWAAARPSDSAHLAWQAARASFAGQARQARELLIQAIAVADGSHRRDAAADNAAAVAVGEALFGNCDRVRKDVERIVGLTEFNWDYGWAAIALGQCGDAVRATTFTEACQRGFGKDPPWKFMWLPVMRSLIALRQGHEAQAVALLAGPKTKYYESGGGYWPQYTRGQAYLASGKGVEAAAEFQTILQHRGWAPLSSIYPLAHVGLARASVLSNDISLAKKEYEAFFALWKDADRDLPILIGAKKEYLALK